MKADDWQMVGQIAGWICLGALVTWRAWRAEKQAEQAKTYAKPTGNGFANEVTGALARIEERQQRSDKVLFDHITAHANADIMRSGRESPSNPNTP